MRDTMPVQIWKHGIGGGSSNKRNNRNRGETWEG